MQQAPYLNILSCESLSLQKFSDKTVSDIGNVLLCEMISALDDFEFQIVIIPLSHLSAVAGNVFVAFAQSIQAGCERNRTLQRWIGEQELGRGAIIIDGTGQRTFLRKNIFVCFQVCVIFVLHDLEDLKIIKSRRVLGQKRHLEVEDVPRHQELLNVAGDRSIPDFAWGS